MMRVWAAGTDYGRWVGFAKGLVGPCMVQGMGYGTANGVGKFLYLGQGSNL